MMEDVTRGTLSSIAGQLAGFVGVIHLGMGVYYTLGVAGATVGSDPRTVLWTLAGTVLVGGVAVAAVGWTRRHLYVAGAVFTGVLVASHALWPVFAGEAFYPGPTPRHSLADPMGYAGALLFETRMVVKVTLATELALLAVLVALIRGERRP